MNHLLCYIVAQHVNYLILNFIWLVGYIVMLLLWIEETSQYHNYAL